MAYIDVSSAVQLTSALQVAGAGDVIRLAAGNYGNVVITAKSFVGAVTITSQDVGHPASFGSLVVKNSANIKFDHVDVDFAPNATTLSFSSAVMIDGSSGISFLNGRIEGGPAVNGVSPDAAYTDATGNILGLPAGRAMTIQNSSNVTVSGSDISQFDRGIAINGKGVTISGNEIHDLRRTAIVGGGDNLLIEDNHMHTARPWHVGLAGGDHADFIALWTDPAQTKPTDNVIIRDNILDRADGAQILGLWLSGDKAGFTNVQIDHNVLIGTDNQGIMLTNVVGGHVTDNVLLQTVHYAGPGILLRDGVQNVETARNIAWAVTDKNATGNNVHDNILAQDTSATRAGYYDGSLLAKVSALQDPAAIYNLVASSLTKAPAPVETASLARSTTVVNTSTLTTDQVLTGNSQSNSLTGGSGNDTLDAGGGGSDTLTGGAGDDTYIVPNSLAVIVEKAGGGTDTVIARGDHVLAANLENLTISSTAGNSWSGTGNDQNNVIIGNAGNNQLSGLAGNDTIEGGAGSDVLKGGAGADFFVMAKGFGADRIADFSYAEGDRVKIAAGAAYTVKQVGVDTVIDLGGGDRMTLTGVSLTSLKAGWISNGVSSAPAEPPPAPVVAPPVAITVAPAAGQTFTGNSQANNLVGGAGADTLNGNGGADTLTGGAGDDVYVVPNSLAVIVEKAGGGIDTVVAKGDHVLGANIENLKFSADTGNGWSAAGNELNNVITGNMGGNKISGLAGNDTIDGGLGVDFIYGGAGNDSIIGGQGNDGLSGGAGSDWFQMARGFGVDRISDFSYAEGDHVRLSGVTSFTVKQVGGDTVIDIGGGDQMILGGVKLASLGEGWLVQG